jgi:hypothetical protein
MEEDGNELIDYLLVIWKRKILIIVGTLVCIVAGVAVSLMSPKKYQAEALMRIGKTVNTRFVSSSSSPSPFILLDTVESLVKTIPIEYNLSKEALEYDLTVNVVNGTSLIEVILKGPDKKKTKEFVDEVVGKLMADHLCRTETSIQYYKTIIGNLKSDIEGIQGTLNVEQLALKAMSINIEAEISIDMEKEMDVSMDVGKIDPITLMIIQNKKIEILDNILRRKELAKDNMLRMKQEALGNLRESHLAIRSLQDDIFMHKLTINVLEENKTRQIGEVDIVTIRMNKKRNIMLAGGVGSIMFLLLAFCIEYVARSGEKIKFSVHMKKSTGE